MNIYIQKEDFDISSLIQELKKKSNSVGAIASFVGLMRDINDGKTIQSMTLEHYPEMTKKTLEDICIKAKEKWKIIDLVVAHRYGSININDNIVFVGVASQHRKDAFEACEFIMDFLKTNATFWKKEHHADGKSSWVDSRKSDDDALNRWQ